MNGKETPKPPFFSNARAPGQHEIQIWQVPLDVPSGMVASLSELLTSTEREQASRFHFVRDQRRFVVRRAVLRQMLSNDLGIRPQMIRLETGRNGKPAVVGPGAAGPLKFSCSHSGDLALIAISRGIELGVDLEQHRELPDAEDLAKAFFSEAEIRELLALPPALKTVGFFNCWTRKEAFVKAIGLGLSFPLNRFSVSLTPGKPAAILEVVGDPGAVKKWSMVSLDAGPNHSAAIVFEGNQAALKFLE